jgi:hypothetical protein
LDDADWKVAFACEQTENLLSESHCKQTACCAGDGC